MRFVCVLALSFVLFGCSLFRGTIRADEAKIVVPYSYLYFGYSQHTIRSQQGRIIRFREGVLIGIGTDIMSKISKGTGATWRLTGVFRTKDNMTLTGVQIDRGMILLTPPHGHEESVLSTQRTFMFYYLSSNNPSITFEVSNVEPVLVSGVFISERARYRYIYNEYVPAEPMNFLKWWMTYDLRIRRGLLVSFPEFPYTTHTFSLLKPGFQMMYQIHHKDGATTIIPTKTLWLSRTRSILIFEKEYPRDNPSMYFSIHLMDGKELFLKPDNAEPSPNIPYNDA